MENLIKKQISEGFFKYPDINFNADTGKCVISGESFMEDSKKYYNTMKEWILEYHETNLHKPLILNLRLEYFNTSSSKMLYELLNTLQTISDAGQDVTVNWYYDSNDSDLEEDIIDLCYDVTIEVNQIGE